MLPFIRRTPSTTLAAVVYGLLIAFALVAYSLS
jgi:hypothetical protein